MPNSSGAERPSWSKLRHLGVRQHHDGIDLRPDLADVGIADVHRVCDRAWMYSRADFEPSVSVALAQSQWRETCALAGSMAESLMLSAAAFIEAEWHGRAIAAGTEKEGMAIGQRYLSDTAVDTVVSVGHRLINFVARVARAAPDTAQKFGMTKHLKLLGPTYVPFETETRGAWLSLNAETMKLLRKTIPGVHSGSLDALDQLLTSTEWKEVDEIRAENFHRWRKEHESVEGVDAQSGSATDLLDAAGNFTGRSISGFPRPHTASSGLTQRTTAAAGAGVRTVAVAVDDVITDTLAVLPKVTGGYTVEITQTGFRKSWKPLTGP